MIVCNAHKYKMYNPLWLTTIAFSVIFHEPCCSRFHNWRNRYYFAFYIRNNHQNVVVLTWFGVYTKGCFAQTFTTFPRCIKCRKNSVLTLANLKRGIARIGDDTLFFAINKQFRLMYFRFSIRIAYHGE